MPGLYLEDCVPGRRIEHAMQRTVTQAENVAFCQLTSNTQPLHLDADYAAKTEFGQLLVNSMLTLSLMVGISVADTTEGTLIANLGVDEASFPSPVFPGDTLHFQSTVHTARCSQSRPSAGVVTFKHVAMNQRGEVVASCLRIVLIKAHDAAPIERG
jgi:acyl dehydratase